MTDAEFQAKAVVCERKLYRVARAILRSDADCEDALQEALFRAWAKRGQLRQIEYFDTWLVRILINECRNIQRRGVKARAMMEPAAPPPDNEALFQALMALPEKYRLPLVLHYIEGYKVIEISQMLRLPSGTVKSRLHHARNIMRHTLGEVEP